MRRGKKHRAKTKDGSSQASYAEDDAINLHRTHPQRDGRKVGNDHRSEAGTVSSAGQGRQGARLEAAHPAYGNTGAPLRRSSVQLATPFRPRDRLGNRSIGIEPLKRAEYGDTVDGDLRLMKPSGLTTVPSLPTEVSSVHWDVADSHIAAGRSDQPVRGLPLRRLRCKLPIRYLTSKPVPRPPRGLRHLSHEADTPERGRYPAF